MNSPFTDATMFNSSLFYNYTSADVYSIVDDENLCELSSYTWDHYDALMNTKLRRSGVPFDYSECVDTALVFDLPMDTSDSDTESEPSTPELRRSSRLSSFTESEPGTPELRHFASLSSDTESEPGTPELHRFASLSSETESEPSTPELRHFATLPSDTEWEPSTSKPRRSARLPKTIKADQQMSTSSCSATVTIKNKRRHGLVSTAGIKKGSPVDDRSRGRSLRSIAASEARRKADRKYACPSKGCGKRYTASHNLNMHMRKHFNIRVYCSDSSCSYSSTWSYDLLRHVRTLHSKPSKKTCTAP
ncbi:hypothetical protein CPB84DRAFT_1221346 [Gymnopilus junonius]|uniref:C2H2-type domain-containing protein n=1 Tax=Gymnopilus junonius TaxID=109634 RepID=A0A9P5TTX1_GYMJU|nr:hypothetical protein CPB84DRAFT_1221346 [Gymnopilus junonius]